MSDLWEKLFAEQGALWDFYPSDSALIALDLFHEKDLLKILIPGIGYGRNAKPFYDTGFEITGIEVSKAAIDLAKENQLDFTIHHGSLTDMPYDNEIYDGIFCYATLHLFNKEERQHILKCCYNQLQKNGLMFFNVVSVDSMMNFSGEQLVNNIIKLDNGLELTFYNLNRIEEEFKNYNITKITKIDEPIKYMKNQKPLHCFNVICQKK